MALGWCMECDTLRTIRPGEQKWGSREVNWYPVPHWLTVHTKCGSPVTERDNTLLIRDECSKCGRVSGDEVHELPCPGHKRAIR